MKSTDVCYEIFTTSTRGPDKTRNGDCAASALLDEGRMLALVVCDGVGSHAYDWLASKTACRAVIGALQEGRGSLDHRMVEAVQIAHGDVQDLESPAHGATTTMVLVIWEIGEDHCRCISIGDSRLYRISENGVERLTQDDVASTPVEIAGELVMTSGVVRFAHALTRAIGHGVLGEVSTTTVPFLEGNLLVAATDGCHELPGFDNILRQIYSGSDLEAAVGRSLLSAHRCEGRDDATAALVRRTTLDGRTLERCRELIDSGRPAQELHVPQHLLERASLSFLQGAAEIRDSAGLLGILDYMDAHGLLLKRDEIAIILDKIDDDGTAVTRQAYRRLTTLLAHSR